MRFPGRKMQSDGESEEKSSPWQLVAPPPRLYVKLDAVRRSVLCSPVNCSCPIGCLARSLLFGGCAMRIPVVCGVIDRRILVNYHVDPNVLAPLLPAPFRPKVIYGVGMIGICLIRLKKVRPASFPSWIGISS